MFDDEKTPKHTRLPVNFWEVTDTSEFQTKCTYELIFSCYLMKLFVIHYFLQIHKYIWFWHIYWGKFMLETAQTKRET